MQASNVPVNLNTEENPGGQDRACARVGGSEMVSSLLLHHILSTSTLLSQAASGISLKEESENE